MEALRKIEKKKIAIGIFVVIEYIKLPNPLIILSGIPAPPPPPPPPLKQSHQSPSTADVWRGGGTEQHSVSSKGWVLSFGGVK